MSTIIRTRSPFFIRTPQVTGSTNIANLSYFQINITVHGGVSSSTEICDDLYAAYALQKKPLGSEVSVTVDISEIVNDHIEQIFTGTYSASSAKSSIWVTVATSARQSDGTIIGSVTTNTYLAQEGYNTFKEGANYTTEPIAMITGTHFEHHKGSTLTIPINVERVSQVEWIGSNGVSVSTDTFSDNGNQNQKIQFAQFTATDVKDIARIKITYDTSSFITIYTTRIEECKYPVNKITFVNRWGAIQDLFFFKKSVDSLENRSENFNRSIFEARAVQLDPPEEEGQDCQESLTFNTYSTTAHAKKTFNANATESVLLNSGFVNELMNPFFEELMVSEYIWLTDSSANIYPVNLKESSFTKKTGLNDRLINYTMSFEKAFALVNNIR
tara:strand:+ start:1660 stop:2817 length:1158 start_codon:yes stop_codon:yes gene_type:complete